MRLKMKKIKEILKNNKENITLYGIIFIMCIFICSPLLQMHIASDTYNFMDLGYFEYPSQYFIRDARLISTLMLYIGGILNLQYETFIVAMQILAVIIATTTIFCIYKVIIDRAKINSKNKKILILFSAFVIVFNCMALEYFLYAECSIMCLSVLISILAAIVFTSNSKHIYIKTLILMILATFCYQGAVNVFLPMVLLLLFIDKDKKEQKNIIKQIILAGTIICISYCVNVITMSISNILLNNEQERVTGDIISNFKNIDLILFIVIKATLITNFNLWPTAITIIVISITFILLLFQEKTTEKILQYLFLIVFSIGICIAPVFFMKNPSVEARMCMSIGSIIGMSFIYLVCLEQNKNILNYIISMMILIFFIYNTVNTIQIFTAHIATNKFDENMGAMIKYEIEKYEKETGFKITKVGACKDIAPRSFPAGWDKKLFSFTQRAFDNFYCLIEALNYFCNRKFEKVEMNLEIYEDNFKGKNWDIYSNEQIVFDKDTMYICTY